MKLHNMNPLVAQHTAAEDLVVDLALAWVAHLLVATRVLRLVLVTRRRLVSRVVRCLCSVVCLSLASRTSTV